MFFVVLLHQLDPLNGDLVRSSINLSLEDGNISSLLERINAASPVNEEVKMHVDLLSHRFEDSRAHLARIVRNLRLELAGVLVDALDRGRVELYREVV